MSDIAAAEPFDLETLPARPWKNGAGLTREIATHPPGAGLDDFEWRFSVAEVAHDGPFSAFPGIDRCIVLLRGDGLCLRFGEGVGEHCLDTPGLPFEFAGERAVDARLLGGATSDFNVMTRRGRWRADITTLRSAAAIGTCDAALLMCCAGEWRVGSPAARTLAPAQGLLWRTNVPTLDVEPCGTHREPWLLAVRLCHDHTP